MNINDKDNVEFKYKTYKTAFLQLLNMAITDEQCKNWFRQLELVGFTEEEICFAISKEYKRIRSWIFNKSFWTYFLKAIFKVYDDERRRIFYVIVKEEKSYKKKKKPTPYKN